MWSPREIIVNNKVRNDPVTESILAGCGDIPVSFVDSGKAAEIIESSIVLKNAGSRMVDRITAGKGILYIAPPGTGIVDRFTMPDARMVCPDFDRLKLASNGCFYHCDWCYLKLTYRAAFPFITIYVQYDRIEKALLKKLDKSNEKVIFNCGELADSLALEHLTGSACHFIPWFGRSSNGYLYMLTKCADVSRITDLPHNGHTVIAWSINNDMISRKFEIGAPPLAQRLNAAKKVQEAGYPLRIRLDPIIPFEGWKDGYRETIKDIFEKVSPERITLGTLRFEQGFYNLKESMLKKSEELKTFTDEMIPMFPPEIQEGFSRPIMGKYSFSEERRVEIFSFAINEIKKYSDCRIALCKESESVWRATGLDVSRCSCVCQLDNAEITAHEAFS